MSSDIYISLRDVLTKPTLFEFRTAYNVGMKYAIAEIEKKEVDWAWVEDCIKPVLTCRFGARKTWRYVDITGSGDEPRSLHVPAGGQFRSWIMEWLNDHRIHYEIV